MKILTFITVLFALFQLYQAIAKVMPVSGPAAVELKKVDKKNGV